MDGWEGILSFWEGLFTRPSCWFQGMTESSKSHPNNSRLLTARCFVGVCGHVCLQAFRLRRGNLCKHDCKITKITYVSSRNFSKSWIESILRALLGSQNAQKTPLCPYLLTYMSQPSKYLYNPKKCTPWKALGTTPFFLKGCDPPLLVKSLKHLAGISPTKGPPRLPSSKTAPRSSVLADTGSVHVLVLLFLPNALPYSATTCHWGAENNEKIHGKWSTCGQNKKNMQLQRGISKPK